MLFANVGVEYFISSLINLERASHTKDTVVNRCCPSMTIHVVCLSWHSTTLPKKCSLSDLMIDSKSSNNCLHCLGFQLYLRWYTGIV